VDQSGNTSSCTATITVIPFNSPPTIIDGAGNSVDTLYYTTQEVTPIQICLSVVDLDLDAVDVTGFFNGPSNGLITGMNDGDTCFTYTPFTGFLGTDFVSIIVCDTAGLCDTVVIVIDVVEILDPPVAVDDTASVPQGGSVIIDNEGNDFDPDGDLFTTTSATSTDGVVVINGDGTLTFTPDPDFCGIAYINYTICDTTGLCDDAVITVDVACDELIIPQGYSPDGDNIADTWVIIGLENYPDNKVQIFNRWGNEIYSAAPYQNDWDGRSQGQMTWSGDLPEGTYYYILELNDEDDPITGYVYIKRKK
jgi:gliding motility-associated-like protein